jgi:hypothetical protein
MIGVRCPFISHDSHYQSVLTVHKITLYFIAEFNFNKENVYICEYLVIFTFMSSFHAYKLNLLCFRFRHGYCKHNPRKMVQTWAEKEMRNLIRSVN